MNTLAADKIRLVIVGATGMVGAYALRCALDNPAIGAVTSIGRGKTGILGWVSTDIGCSN